MKVLYIRVSSPDQNIARQERKGFDKVYIDKVSGAIAFDKRPSSGQLMDDARDGKISEVHVKDVDRLGRDLLDLLVTLKEFNELGVTLVVETIGRSRVDDKPNPIFGLMVGLLGTVAEMERNKIRDTQRQGILIAQEEGRYNDRPTRDAESLEDFKAKYRREIKQIKNNSSLSLRDLSKLTGVSVNTIMKLKKAINVDQETT